MSIRTFGYIQSKLTGNEKKVEVPQGVRIFDSYDLRGVLDGIRDQGQVPKCVSCAMTDVVRYKMNMGIYEKCDFDDALFYDNRPDYGDGVEGMCPIDAFKYLEQEGVCGQKGQVYAMVDSVQAAKYSIITNGPLMACLMVRSYDDDFWNGEYVYGGHAVTLVGYDKNGFILRNSWGEEFGNKGYVTFPFSKFKYGLEYWTLIA